MQGEAARIADFMSHEPQTNEVRRSAVLLPGFLTIAAETGLPLRILELGASAGLNQLWDRRHYRLGEIGEWGLILPCEAAKRFTHLADPIHGRGIGSTASRGGR
jgi:hypothetical protein